jgi:hypothetical protein
VRPVDVTWTWDVTVHNAPARFAQGKKSPPAPGETLRLTPQFIDRRESFAEEDGGGSCVRLGLSAYDKSRFGIDRIEIDCPDDDDNPAPRHQGQGAFAGDKAAISKNRELLKELMQTAYQNRSA